jgi:hypothetical protein
MLGPWSHAHLFQVAAPIDGGDLEAFNRVDFWCRCAQGTSRLIPR